MAKVMVPHLPRKYCERVDISLWADDSSTFFLRPEELGCLVLESPAAPSRVGKRLGRSRTRKAEVGHNGSAMC